MSVLMIDVGGSYVKIMASHQGEMRKMPSGQKLSASEMERGVLELASDLELERISLGFPGLVEHGSPSKNPTISAMGGSIVITQKPSANPCG